MPIPQTKTATTEVVVKLGDEETRIVVRSLTREEATFKGFLERSQAVESGDLTQVPEIDVFLLACGLATDGEEVIISRDGERVLNEEWVGAVREWWAVQSASAIDQVNRAIARISGLDQEGQRGADPGDPSGGDGLDRLPDSGEAGEVAG